MNDVANTRKTGAKLNAMPTTGAVGDGRWAEDGGRWAASGRRRAAGGERQAASGKGQTERSTAGFVDTQLTREAVCVEAKIFDVHRAVAWGTNTHDRHPRKQHARVADAGLSDIAFLLESKQASWSGGGR